MVLEGIQGLRLLISFALHYSWTVKTVWNSNLPIHTEPLVCLLSMSNADSNPLIVTDNITVYKKLFGLYKLEIKDMKVFYTDLYLLNCIRLKLYENRQSDVWVKLCTSYHDKKSMTRCKVSVFSIQYRQSTLRDLKTGLCGYPRGGWDCRELFLPNHSTKPTRTRYKASACKT